MRGQWAVYYTGPQSFLTRFLIRWLYNFGDIKSFLIGRFIKLSIQTFQPMIVLYISGNFCLSQGYEDHCIYTLNYKEASLEYYVHK